MPKYKRFFNNYSMVFITIITNHRIHLLIDNIELFRKSFKLAKYKFNVLAGVVLPDHTHFIIEPKNIEEVPKIIASIKYYFSHNVKYQKQNKTNSEIK